MRKQMITWLTAALLTMTGAAYAEGICEPSQVDVSGVQLIDGQLRGEIGLPQGASNGVLKIDCPLPSEFAPDQRLLLDVEYRAISKSELMDALETVGQTVSAEFADDFFGSDGMSMGCWVHAQQGLHPYGSMGARSMLLKDLSQRADATLLTQAGALLCDTLRALDITPCENLLDLCMNSLDDLYTHSPTGSDASAFAREEQLRNWREIAERDGRDPDEKLAYARVCYELYGLPVAISSKWWENDTKYNAPVVADCAMCEDGTIASLDVRSVPKVRGVAPMTVPAMEWQTWLQGWVARFYTPFANAQDEPYEDYGFGEGLNYAKYDVIRSIMPCWVGIQKNQLEPGWRVEVENRVAKDDSLDVTLSSADALSAFVEGVEVQ